MRSPLSRVEESPNKTEGIKKENLIDSGRQPISGAILGSNKINTDASSNRRAAGGVDEFLCPCCVYFRQYFQPRERQETEAERDTTKESLKVRFVEMYNSVLAKDRFCIFSWSCLYALNRLTACLICGFYPLTLKMTWTRFANAVNFFNDACQCVIVVVRLVIKAIWRSMTVYISVF